jgi:transcriptional regulator with XRE-family HTH domain
MKRESTINNFGKRLAAIRKEQGLTQRKLAELIDVSERMIAYYEAESKYPPMHLIIPLTKVLRISADKLLGIKTIKHQLNPKYAALWRKLKKAEFLPPRDKKSLLRYLNTLLKKNKLKD